MNFNVLDYGAVSDYRILNTEAVQRAIDAAAEAGGGTVYFPKGIYVLSTVFLKSNITIEITKEALILGALSFYDYAQPEKYDFPLYQDCSHSNFHCSLFVGLDCDNIKITGGGRINMRSVWDEDDVRNIVHRGPKCITLRSCKNVEISNIEISNATDLAIYFTACENVDIFGIKMRVYIDGISPDNSKNVRIHDCDVESGDDGIVFKSSYNMNRIDICKNIHVYNCRVKSRCSALKFGTETNGGFEDILIENIEVSDTRISGIAIESVDGAIIDGITMRNIKMVNVNGPIFIHIGSRMRGPEGREIGHIRNVTLENVTLSGPYEPYHIMEAYYKTYCISDRIQYPWAFRGKIDPEWETKKENRFVDWQFTSNICGLPGIPLENITLRNVHLIVDGGCQSFNTEVPEDTGGYPEINIYGNILPAKGIFFRHVRGLVLDNVTVESERPDAREDFVFVDVE